MLPYPEQASRAALVLAAFALLAFSSPAHAQTVPAPAAPAASVADPVVAIVNGSEVHRSDVEAAREDLPQQYQSYPFEVIYPALLERLVDGKLLVAAGRAEGLATDADVKARLARLEDQVDADMINAGKQTVTALRVLRDAQRAGVPQGEPARARGARPPHPDQDRG